MKYYYGCGQWCAEFQEGEGLLETTEEYFDHMVKLVGDMDRSLSLAICNAALKAVE